MYDDTVTGKCRCQITSTCSVHSNDCNCEAYCEIYAGAVARYIDKQYVTISPDPLTIANYSKMHESYIEGLFHKLVKVTNDFIIVLELAGLRPHYHCIFDVRDRVGFNIKLLNHSKYNNVKKHGPFKQGLHYLFKDVVKTHLETNIVPILERSDVITDYSKIKSVRASAVIRNDLDYREIPKCFLYTEPA